MNETGLIGQRWRIRTIDGEMVIRVVAVHPVKGGRPSPRGRRIDIVHIAGAVPHPDNQWREGDLIDSPNAECVA